MKLAIAYDGTEKTGKNRFRLTNKVACANFETITKFHLRKEGVIAARYNIDEVEVRVLNGDGAAWIKHKKHTDTIYQLDTFHRNRAILRAVQGERHRRELFKTLYEGDIEYLLLCIDTLIGMEQDATREEALKELYIYFDNNKEGLVPWQERVEAPAPPVGKEYRNTGAMESNVFSIIGNRMKGRRRCFSIKGGNNLARLLCLNATGELHSVVSVIAKLLPEKYEEEVITTMSAAKVKESIGSGFDGFKSFVVPSSQKWLKDLVKIRPLGLSGGSI
jgi:hypothetical protein